MEGKSRSVRIQGARENNLKNVSLEIPHGLLVVVTGVSGSGKSSLINEVLNREGQRLFYENFTEGRFHSGKKIAPPEADHISGLFPTIAVNQLSVVRNPRSTVGTLTEIHDFLRLLFSRFGQGEQRLSRAHFSWNHPSGQCPLCKGLGVEDHIDPDLIVGDPGKTIREGALVLTTPNQYIIYSQVTMDVLNQVCEAEGFSVDIPWKDLEEKHKNIIWYGSEKIKILFGKHPLENRLKWSGITAKPREEGYYKGILPVMEEILKRDRNPNILRFVRSFSCPECKGLRLNQQALSVTFEGRSIANLLELSIGEVNSLFAKWKYQFSENSALSTICETIVHKTGILSELGLSYLSLSRESTSLSGGESGRIRLGNQVSTGLRNILYILDEPSAGLHPAEQQKLLGVIRSLVSSGNTVVAVEHDELTMRAADHIIDIGPGPGDAGGEILYNGPADSFFASPPEKSVTARCFAEERQIPAEPFTTRDNFTAINAGLNNLKNISVSFRQHAFNVITGVSGSGKSSLADFLRNHSIPSGSGGCDAFSKVIHVDQSPIGRTPNSNPATYTGLSDHIRDLFASLPESKARGFKKGQFSFVVRGGRCESCGGAGSQQVGMHFLGNVSVVCEDCNGKRFSEDTLSVHYRGKSIFDVLEMTLAEAHEFFSDQKKIRAYTSILSELGLGYLKLGQASNTLSGGEAQRVKLATELVRSATSHTLYILDEPTTGLHMADVRVLLAALKSLIAKGHTLLCIEHDPFFILHADHIADLGPGSGREGGSLVFSGSPAELLKHSESLTARALRQYLERDFGQMSRETRALSCDGDICLEGVRTHNLKNISVSFPPESICLVSGRSGSGKSSLVIDTLYAESQRRFMEGMSSYIRQFIGKAGNPELESATGLMPALCVEKKKASGNPRSTAGTYTGLYDLYRLLFSRVATNGAGEKHGHSGGFSFNNESGACPQCKGLGSITTCDPEKLITHPHLPLIAGALSGSTTGRFYGDPDGQFAATLMTVGRSLGFDFSVSWKDLGDEARKVAMFGCGETVFEVDWKYKRGNHQGIHHLTTVWPGFTGLVNEEYVRKHADHRGETMMPLMRQEICGMCGGTRLRREILEYRIGGKNIAEVCTMENAEALDWFTLLLQNSLENNLDDQATERIGQEILRKLESMKLAGLEYLSADRLISTLSGGEFQRIRMAGLARSPLCGLCIVIDEPSFGLHFNDRARIADIIRRVRQNGNTVVMIDHSPEMAGIASYAVKLGPGAGPEGGEIIYQGSAETIRQQLADGQSRKILMKENTDTGILIRGACANNLKNLDINFPSGQLVVISGASGSGKTSLAEEVIMASFRQGKAVHCSSISGLEQFNDIVYIEQDIPHGSALSVPATHLGIFDIVRKTFAASQEARARNLTASHFSFNKREGQCSDCQGKGYHEVSMDFWSNSRVLCESCKGSRYNNTVLQISIGGLNIAGILSADFRDFESWCREYCAPSEWKKIQHTFSLINMAGLFFLSAGQAMETLSTGELQRLKLVKGISGSKGKTLYILDEPTGGLHPEDTRDLLILFQNLLIMGHSLLCISHDRLIIEAAHTHIELGPGGGKHGGYLMEQNTGV